MKRKILLYIVILSVLSSSILLSLDYVGAAETPQDTLYVGGGGWDAYSKIQTAVNRANPGDIVYVYNGVYQENLVIDKSISLIGEDEQETIIDGNGLGDVINITTSQVNVSGVTLKNGKDSDINRSSIRI